MLAWWSECPPLSVCAAEIAVVICQDSKLEVLCSQVQSCPSVTTVIKIGGALSEEEKALAEKTGVKLYCMEEVEVRERVDNSNSTRVCAPYLQVLGRDNKAESVVSSHSLTHSLYCSTHSTHCGV